MARSRIGGRVFFWVLWVCAVPGWGAQPGKGKAASAAYEAVPFDVARASLPAMFKGHDAVKIFEAFRKTPAPVKGEFESTSAFEGRRAMWLKKPYMGAVTPESMIALVVHPLHGEITTFYDADTNRFSWNVEFHQCNGSDGMTLMRMAYPDGTYIGTNGFGVKRRITRYRQYELCATIGWPSGYEFTTRQAFAGEAQLSIEDAKRLKSQFAMLLIGRLQEPYVAINRDATSATLNNPNEILTVESSIAIELRGLWVFNLKTGAVLTKAVFPRPDLVDRAEKSAHVDEVPGSQN